MSGRILNWAARISAGDLTAKAVLLVLAEAANEQAETIIGQDTIAERLETSRETVTRAMKRLEQRGLITRLRRRREGGYRTSDLVKLTLCDLASRDFPSRDDFSRDANADSYVTQDHSLTPSINPQIKDTSEGPSESKTRTKKQTPNDPAFESLWLAYPHFKGRSKKPKAYKEWSKLGPDDKSAIVGAVCEYASTPNAIKENHLYVPQMHLWIRDEQWRDFVMPVEPPQESVQPDWAARMTRYTKDGTWLPSWGEKPGKSGCQVPAQFLAEHPPPSPPLRVIDGGAR
jgi:biotin operon repressor